MLGRHPLRICTAREMRELDLRAEREFKIDASLLMENAGRAASQILLEKYPNAGKLTEILVFAGKGNNAGDAFVAARRLFCLEKKVRVFHLSDEADMTPSTKKAFQILRSLKVKTTQIENVSELDTFFQSSKGPFTLIDGLFGTGFKGPLDGLFYEVIMAMNSLKCPEVIALDIPSGVSGDTGVVHGTSVLATLTISFGFPKLGHFLPPGAIRRGELINVDISLPPQFSREGNQFLLTPGILKDLLHERDRYGHKNSFGHTLLVGGSPGRLGAIEMAARACHKMGTGLVTVASWEDSMPYLYSRLSSESMAIPIRMDEKGIQESRKAIAECSSLVIGPGLGQRPDGKKLIEEILNHYSGPLVIDADALNLIAEHKLFENLKNRRTQTILTPHVGEMARLLNVPKEVVQDDPMQALRDCVQKTYATVVLKGAATLVAGPLEDRIYLNHYPNDGMATAGSGDVLAGMIGGLLGQKMSAFDAARLGVYLHSLAGDFAARTFGHRSMTAADIINNISSAYKELSAPQNTATQTAGRIRLL